MAKLKLDLHDIFNRGERIDAALERVIHEAMDKRIPTVESGSSPVCVRASKRHGEE